MRYLLSVLVISVLFYCCKKTSGSAGDPVEIYALQSFKLVPGKCQVDGASAVLELRPVVFNNDIIYYSKSDHQYKLTDTSYQKLKLATPRNPFAVTVNKEVIFFMIYMPPILSSTCDQSITMDLGWGLPGANKININLGYPSFLGSNVDDKRNSAVLMAALAKQGKLK